MDHVNMKYQTHKKFLDVDFFKKLKGVILHEDFPWRKRDQLQEGVLYFNYCFYNDMNSQSHLYEPHIIPILKKLKAVAPLQVRANMLISKLFKASDWHCDYKFNCMTAILYLNDCDGGTELKINNKIIFIKAEANKMLIFDTNVLHRPITSKDQPIRYILNFNYYMEGGKI